MSLAKINFIQVLRSVAFIFVLLFHLDIPFFSGGYLGVNLFFMLSGFIITKISFDIKNVRSIKEIVHFLKKRLFKLFPYLFLTVLFVNILGPLLLGEILYSKLSIQSFSSIFFISNIHYYFEGGYFDFYSKQNPLLHLWSLAVELQFYIIFTFLIYTFSTYYKKIYFYFFLLILFFCITYIYKESVNAIFYFSIFRFYEFILGSIVFLLYNKIFLKKFSNIACSVGIVLIFFVIISSNPSNIFFESHYTKAKLYASLILSIGFLLIAISRESFFDKLIFNKKIFKYLGDESYILYLIHWPVIIFYKSFTNNNSLNLLDIGLIIIIILITKALFERSKSFIFNKNRIFLKILTFSLFLIFIFFPKNTQFNEGQKNNYFIDIKSKEIIDKKILIVGDSHALHLYYGIKEKNKNTKLIENNFLIDNNFYLSLEEELIDFKPDILIFAMRWDHSKKINRIRSKYHAEFNEDVFKYYTAQLSELSSMVKVYTDLIIVGSLPLVGYANSSIDCLTRKIKLKSDICSHSNIYQNKNILNRYKFNQYLKKTLINNDIKFIDPFTFLCEDFKCLNIINDKHIYIDDNHLSNFGSSMLANELLSSQNIMK